MEWWLWIVLGLGLLVLEIVIPGGLFALFFGLGALAVGALVAVGAGGPAAAQWITFSVLSILSLVLVRRRLRGKLDGTGRPVDPLVGELAIPLDDLPPRGAGKVELRGTPWNARNAGDAPLARGQRCHVERVDGLTVWVAPE